MKIKLRQPYSFCQLGDRDGQEDARYPDTDIPAAPCSVFVVCDGVGGRAKGEVASRIVADALGESMDSLNSEGNLTDRDLEKALAVAYDKLEKNATGNNREMATTMTVVAFHAGGAMCAHIGDSRIYQVRPGAGVIYRSEDHSLVNELVHAGVINPEEAKDHPQSNVITRCLTCRSDKRYKDGATVAHISDIKAGDYFFLCSDGVLHFLDDDYLVSILSSDVTDKDKIDTIARICRHSSDNNTAYLIGIDGVTHDDGDDVSKAIVMTEVEPLRHEKNNIMAFIRQIFKC